MIEKPVRFSRVLLVFSVATIVVMAGDLALRGRHRIPVALVHTGVEGDVERGRRAIRRVGCGACHTIPGIRNAVGRVGPQLADIRNQIYLGGVLPNNPDNMASWIRNARAHNPLSAMPNLSDEAVVNGLTEQDAQDIAAYLYSES